MKTPPTNEDISRHRRADDSMPEQEHQETTGSPTTFSGTAVVGQPHSGLPYTTSHTLRIARRNRCRNRAHLLPPETSTGADIPTAPKIVLAPSETDLGGRSTPNLSNTDRVRLSRSSTSRRTSSRRTSAIKPPCSSLSLSTCSTSGPEPKESRSCLLKVIETTLQPTHQEYRLVPQIQHWAHGPD